MDEHVTAKRDARIPPEPPLVNVAVGQHDLDRPRSIRRRAAPDTEGGFVKVVVARPRNRAAHRHGMKIPTVENIEEDVSIRAEHLDIDVVVRPGLPAKEEIDGVTTRNPPIDVEGRKAVEYLLDREWVPR